MLALTRFRPEDDASVGDLRPLRLDPLQGLGAREKKAAREDERHEARGKRARQDPGGRMRTETRRW